MAKNIKTAIATKAPTTKASNKETKGKSAKAPTKETKAKAPREVHKASDGGSFDREKLKTNWSAKQVKEARARHHKIKVGKEVYGSVYKAFLALSLPVWQHQAFRKVLKLSKTGRETFEFKGKKIAFEIAK